MRIPFTKMHGIGNDYIYIDCLTFDIPSPENLSRAMSPRHFSVGADGIVLICPSAVADAEMKMFNADGSEGKMCGNAIRCVGKYLYDNKLTDKTKLSIDTLSGIKHLTLYPENGRVKEVKVAMGTASFEPKDIPVLREEKMINQPIEILGQTYNLTAVSMGNPHAVCFLPEIDDLLLEKIGPKFENLPIFPERVNTEFVKIIDDKTLKMRVWERGSGETYACGTGACATVAAAVVNGVCPPDKEITVRLIGGDLKITCASDMSVTMTGEAQKVYEGVYEYEC